MRKRRGRHEGTLRQRGDGLWEARRDVGISDKGKRRSVSAYGKTKAEALAALGKKVTVTRAAMSVTATVGEYLKAWLAESRLRTAYTTQALREGVCRKHVLPYIGGVSLQRLEPHHVADLLLQLQRDGVGAATLQKLHSVLSAAFNEAVKRNVLMSNPMAKVRKPRAVRKPIEPWSPEEARKFLNAMYGQPYYALFVLALTTGMRQGELFGLQWRDLEGTRLRVVRSLAAGPSGPVLKEPKTAASIRTIELCGLAVLALAGLPRTEGYVFTSPDGEPIRKDNFMRRVFDPAVKRAGVRRITFHALRHTSNTLLLREGVSPNVVAQRMGHSSTRMTLDVYGHVLTGAQRVAADKLDAVFAGSSLVKTTETEALPAK